MFTFDPTAVAASIETFPKGEYEFIVGEPKTFLKKSGEDQHDSYGIGISLEVGSATVAGYEGKRTFYRMYFQSEGGQGFAKQFIMACLGYGKGKAEEERFNREKGSEDWNFDPVEKEIGEAWKQLNGQRVIGQLDTQPNKNKPEEEMQQFKGWRSLTSGPLK